MIAKPNPRPGYYRNKQEQGEIAEAKKEINHKDQGGAGANMNADFSNDGQDVKKISEESQNQKNAE